MKQFRALAVVCSMVLFVSAAFGQTGLASPVLSGPVLSTPGTYSVDGVSARVLPNGGKSWDLLKGVLPTGEKISLHESVQPVGVPPNPAHSIQHSEVITVIEGTVAFEHDGKSEKVGPGGVIFVAMGTMHAVRNVGTVPARYTVLMIGGDTK
jgi:mannose-6-phosphate isomerase-like protein (cupin superfamily)